MELKRFCHLFIGFNLLLYKLDHYGIETIVRRSKVQTTYRWYKLDHYGIETCSFKVVVLVLMLYKLDHYGIETISYTFFYFFQS